jgi:hypothetical protein
VVLNFCKHKKTPRYLWYRNYWKIPGWKDIVTPWTPFIDKKTFELAEKMGKLLILTITGKSKIASGGSRRFGKAYPTSRTIPGRKHLNI